MQPDPSPAPGIPPKPRRASSRRTLYIAQPLRFAAAGGAATAVNWTARFPLSHVVPFATAVALAYGVGMVAGFVLYREWVFKGSEVLLHHQLWRFLLVNAAGFGAVVLGSDAALSALDAAAALPRGWMFGAAHAAGLIVGAVVNYLGHRTLTFARREPPPVSAGRSSRP